MPPARLHRFLPHPVLRLVLILAAVLALLLTTWRFRAQVADVIAHANIGILALSVLLALLANFLTGLPLRSFLRQHRIEISAGTACYLQLVAQLAKYIPGNIWGAVLQAQLSGGQSAVRIFMAGTDTSIFLMLIISITGVALLAYGHHPVWGVLIAVTGWIVTSIISATGWLVKLTAKVARLLGKNFSENADYRPKHEASGLFVWALLHTVVYSASVIALLLAATRFDVNDILIGTASIFLAWVIGTLAIFFPSGLGIREIAFVSLATAFGASAPPETLVAIAIVARVAQTLPDILALVIVAAVEGTRTMRNRRPA